MKKSVFFIRFSLIHFCAVLIATMFFSACQPPQPTEETEAEDPMKTEEVTKDMGRQPWVLDIEKETTENPNYRQAKWTGEYMQMVFMSLEPGEAIDLEKHEVGDQFIRIEQGEARILMGEARDSLLFDKMVQDDWAIFIPAGYWHEIRNTGENELKLYAIYAPAEHPSGTIHETYEDAKDYEHEH